MVIASGFLDNLSQLASIINPLLVVLAGAVISYFVRVGNRRELIRVNLEKLRLSYRRLNITQETTLTSSTSSVMPSVSTPASSASTTDSTLLQTVTPPTPNASQYLVFSLSTENIGDGPIDIWGCFVAARELSMEDQREAWGGNIGWDDFDPYYFDSSLPEGARELEGISVTRHLAYSQDDYIKVDAKERDIHVRFDKITALSRNVTLIYRVFLVGRGYEPKRKSHDRDLLAYRDLVAWQRLQQALFNISGPSFRILFGEDDPLALVADRDGWQCFMLYHRAFAVDNRDGIGWTTIDHVNSQLTGRWGVEHTAEEARRLCEVRLADEIARWSPHWNAFKQAVQECRLTTEGFASLLMSGWRPTVTHMPKGSADDLSSLSARDAFNRLPPYLRWDPNDDDSLAIWQRFFLVALKPEERAETR